MKSTLRKYDDVLTAEERFRLALAALARDDDAEVHHLHATCPRYTYMMQDTDFSNRWRGSHDVAQSFCVAWLWNHQQFTQAQWCLVARERAVRDGLTTATATETVELVMRRGRELKGVYVALLRFCDAVRLDWRDLLQWWPPILDEIEMVRVILDSDDYATSEETADVTYQLLVTVWRVPLESAREGGRREDEHDTQALSDTHGE